MARVALGGVIGARLLQAGYPVTLIARGEHADHMRRQGLHFLAPGEDVTLPVRVVSHPRELAFNADDVVLLCMKSLAYVAGFGRSGWRWALATFPLSVSKMASPMRLWHCGSFLGCMRRL